MGRDKALIEVDGVPMWRRQRDVLAAAGAGEIFLSARLDQPWAYAADGFAAVLNDALPDCGPIVGISAAIERASHPHVAVLAIDLPQMTPAWFAKLLGRSGPGVGAVGRRDGFFEPLAAIYPGELKWLAWETIAAGEYSLQAMIKAAVNDGLLHAVDIGGDEAALFENRNAPAG